MDLGYSSELYILAFDHRGSFTKRFGIEGEPMSEDYQRFADGKHLIFEGIEAALARGADPSVTGALVEGELPDHDGRVAATRLLATAGVGGVILTVWALEKRGMQVVRSRCVCRPSWFCSMPPSWPHGAVGLGLRSGASRGQLHSA
jgi:hypothetical protein